MTRGSEQDIEDYNATRPSNTSFFQLLEGGKSGLTQTDAPLPRSKSPTEQPIAELFAFEDPYIHTSLGNTMGLPGILRAGDNDTDLFMYTEPVDTGIDHIQRYENHEMLPGQCHNSMDAERDAIMPQSLTAVRNGPQSSNSFPGSELDGTAVDGIASIGMLLRLVTDLHARLAVLKELSWQSQLSIQDLQHYPLAASYICLKPLLALSADSRVASLPIQPSHPSCSVATSL